MGVRQARVSRIERGQLEKSEVDLSVNGYAVSLSSIAVSLISICPAASRAQTRAQIRPLTCVSGYP
jgi:hypothetical protein